MQEKNTLQLIMFYLGILFILALFAAIYFQEAITSLVMETTGESAVIESQKSTNETTNLLLSLDKISFDTSVLGSTYLQNLFTFPSYPIDAQTLSNFGKANPFVGSFSTVPSQSTTTTTGGVVYSSQRSLNNGEAVRAVVPTRR